MSDYYLVINGKYLFDQSAKNNLKTCDSIQKIATVQGDDYTTDCLLDFNNFKDYCKMIATDLRNQGAVDSYPKAI